jgi:hypothetical protein
MAKDIVVKWDIDSAESLCGGYRNASSYDDCVYWQVAKGKDGWYVSAMVDSKTGNFVDDLFTDDGPYDTEAEAHEVGLLSATNWINDNGFQFSRQDYTKLEQRLIKPEIMSARETPHSRDPFPTGTCVVVREANAKGVRSRFGGERGLVLGTDGGSELRSRVRLDDGVVIIVENQNLIKL